MAKRTEAVSLRVLLLIACMGVQGSYLSGFSPKNPAGTRMTQLDDVASRLATSLDVLKRVEVLVVMRNDLVVSVEPLPGAGEGYRVVFDQRFFDQLTDEEIAAALAHEIGHVWIYSHFPFLQTEALANEIALKVAPRKAMESLYAKLWAYTGVKGKIEELLGSDKMTNEH
jgi:hypothetical protein